MSRGLADTSIFIAQESGRAIDVEALPDELGVSVITIGELRAGVLSASNTTTRDHRLSTLTSAMGLDPQPITDSVAAAWARLRLLLREAGMRMPINDSWIAATAMALSVPVVTQDADFIELSELAVIRV